METDKRIKIIPRYVLGPTTGPYQEELQMLYRSPQDSEKLFKALKMVIFKIPKTSVPKSFVTL